MPYKSLKQERYFNANRSKLEKQGVNVDEWNKASKGMKFKKKPVENAKENKMDKKMGVKEMKNEGMEKDMKKRMPKGVKAIAGKVFGSKMKAFGGKK